MIIRDQVSVCRICGKEAVLDGRGRCMNCFDQEVDNWEAPLYLPLPHTKEWWREKKRIWQATYRRKHKTTYNKYMRESRKRRIQEHPEVLIRERDYKRRLYKAGRHPCIECGGLCGKESKRCRPCYYKLLRTSYNPIRGHIRAFWEGFIKV